MNATIVAVDLAKNIFELAVAGEDWRIAQRQRLTRAKFLGFFVRLAPCQVVMEACGSAHYWARRISQLGHTVRLLPAQYVKAYVRRNKTDQADAAALIEAARCAEIRAVPVKTVEAQQIQSLHRLRSQWMSTRQRYVNTLRGILREFGFAIPLGVNVAKDRISAALADPESEVPQALRATLAEMLQEIRLLEQKILNVEHQLNALTRADVRVQQLRQIPGIGALTSTALRAVVGDIQRFPSGRHFASWLGLTPNERSSAEKRRLGKISKQGDTYLRTLLVHGARSALLAAHRAERSGHSLDRLRRWALDCERPARSQQGHRRARQSTRPNRLGNLEARASLRWQLGAQLRNPMNSSPQRCVREMTIMISGSVRDAGKPITIVACEGLPTVWLRVRGSHDVQSFQLAAAHIQDGYPVATDSRCSSIKTFSKGYLTEESIPDC